MISSLLTSAAPEADHHFAHVVDHLPSPLKMNLTSSWNAMDPLNPLEKFIRVRRELIFHTIQSQQSLRDIWELEKALKLQYGIVQVSFAESKMLLKMMYGVIHHFTKLPDRSFFQLCLALEKFYSRRNPAAVYTLYPAECEQLLEWIMNFNLNFANLESQDWEVLCHFIRLYSSSAMNAQAALFTAQNGYSQEPIRSTILHVPHQSLTSHRLRQLQQNTHWEIIVGQRGDYFLITSTSCCPFCHKQNVDLGNHFGSRSRDPQKTSPSLCVIGKNITPLLNFHLSRLSPAHQIIEPQIRSFSAYPGAFFHD